MKTIPLKQLATKIKAEHEQVVQTVRKSLGHAKKAGELLAKAQKEIQKTTALKWGRWVEQECGIQQRTWLAPILCTRRCESRINRYRWFLGPA